jgi:hypothetical protein
MKAVHHELAKRRNRGRPSERLLMEQANECAIGVVCWLRVEKWDVSERMGSGWARMSYSRSAWRGTWDVLSVVVIDN